MHYQGERIKQDGHSPEIDLILAIFDQALRDAEANTREPRKPKKPRFSWDKGWDQFYDEVLKYRRKKNGYTHAMNEWQKMVSEKRRARRWLIGDWGSFPEIAKVLNLDVELWRQSVYKRFKWAQEMMPCPFDKSNEIHFRRG